MEAIKETKSIRFAFAVSHSKTFEACHFGDADKYLIFDWDGAKIEYQTEVLNSFKDAGEAHEHGSEEKGNAIIDLLQQNKVKVMVSKQFGRNIKLVNRYFIPIIIDKETIDEAMKIITRHLNWIQDELDNNQKEYKLFMLRKGVLKTAIKK